MSACDDGASTGTNGPRFASVTGSGCGTITLIATHTAIHARPTKSENLRMVRATDGLCTSVVLARRFMLTAPGTRRPHARQWPCARTAPARPPGFGSRYLVL